MADRSGGRLFSDSPFVLANVNTVEAKRRTFYRLGHSNRGNSTPNTRLYSYIKFLATLQAPLTAFGVAYCYHLAAHFRDTRPGPFNRRGSNRPPARIYTVSGHTAGPFLLDGVAVKCVGVVLINADVLVPRVVITVLLDGVVIVQNSQRNKI